MAELHLHTVGSVISTHRGPDYIVTRFNLKEKKSSRFFTFEGIKTFKDL